MVTRNEVARKAGVSVAVVSYVMNNKNNVKPETRNKVLKAMKELNYLPNPTARSLKTRKTHQLLVLVNYLGNPFEAGILLHLEEEARALGYSLIFQTYHRAREGELMQIAVDGVILLGQSLLKETLQFYASRRIPIVSVTQPACADSEYTVPYVDIDWLEAYGNLIRLLIEQGRTDIVYMTHGDENNALHPRMEAFCTAIGNQGLNVRQPRLLQGGGRFESARQCVLETVRAGRFPYHAMVCANDLMAIGVLSALKEERISVPGTIAIIGSENILMTSETEPPIACIHFPRKEAARQALVMLGGMMPSADSSEVPCILQGNWVQRASV